MNAGDLVRLIHRATAPMWHRLNMTVSRMVLDAVNEAAQRQGLRVLVLADEVIDDVEHFQPGGLSHVPLAGAEGVLLCVGGNRAHPVAVGVSNAEARPTGLLPGETALYAAQPGTGGLKVLLDADGNIVLTPTGKVTIDGNLIVSGHVAAAGEVFAMSATTPVSLSLHLHPTPLGPTQVPTPGPPPPP